MSGQQEVESFLSDMGLESCVQAVVHNGFYTSMEALRGATYEELVDSGVRPVHAKLILSSLGSKGGQGPLPGGLAPSQGADEVAHFLRSIGLENCAAELGEAGYSSLDKLGDASMQDLLNAGLKPVHARLIASNLDSASTAGITMTPAAQRLASIDAEETLLGAPLPLHATPPRRHASPASDVRIQFSCHSSPSTPLQERPRRSGPDVCASSAAACCCSYCSATSRMHWAAAASTRQR